MNDEIKLSAQSSFMKKGTVQRRKSLLMKLTSSWTAQTLTKKTVMSKPWKITMF